MRNAFAPTSIPLPGSTRTFTGSGLNPLLLRSEMFAGRLKPAQKVAEAQTRPNLTINQYITGPDAGAVARESEERFRRRQLMQSLSYT